MTADALVDTTRPLCGPGRWWRVAPFAAIAAAAVGLAATAPDVDAAAVAVAGALVLAVVAATALPWHRWPAPAQAVPPLGYYALALLLQYATGGHERFYFLVALPVIWCMLFHGRRAMLVNLALLVAVLGLPSATAPEVFPPPAWATAFLTFALSTLGGLGGQHLVTRTRQAAAAAAEALARARAAERRFAGVLSAATAQMIVSIDTDGRFTVFNQGAERMLGYTSEEVVGKATVELIHVPEELEALARRFGRESFLDLLRWASPKMPILTEEWTLIRKDGRRVPVAMSITPRIEEGQVKGYVAVGRDVTAERAAAAATAAALERERAAAERARELERMRADFVAMISHDLRTPLTSISGSTELVLSGEAGPLTDPQRRLLKVVSRNSRRLGNLVSDLLLLSRIEAGTLKVEPRVVPLAEVVDGGLEAVVARSTPDVQLVVDYPAVPALVRVDPRQMERVVTNLVSNAFKFTPPGGRVSVAVAADPGRVRLRVSDTGIGLSDEELPHVFDRFFRSNRTSSKDRSGTGLGLTIAKLIVEQHGGTIRAGRSPEGGASFEVTLPRVDHGTMLARERAGGTGTKP